VAVGGDKDATAGLSMPMRSHCIVLSQLACVSVVCLQLWRIQGEAGVLMGRAEVNSDKDRLLTLPSFLKERKWSPSALSAALKEHTRGGTSTCRWYKRSVH
jgi:hypothetical protein